MHRASIALGLVALCLVGAAWLRRDQRQAEAATFIDTLEEDLDRRLAPQRAPRAASDAVALALDSATTYLALPRDAAALDDAAAAGRDGDYAQMRTIARRVLELRQTPDIAARASAVCIYATLREDRCQEIEACQVHLLAALDPARPATAWPHLWSAECSATLGDWQAVFEHTAAIDPLLDRRVEFHAARMLALRAAAQLAPSPSTVAAVDALIRELPEYPRRATVQLELAQAELSAGLRTDAARRLDRFVWEHPAHPLAADASALRAGLIEAGIGAPARSVEELRTQGRALRLERLWSHAEALLRQALDEAANESERDLVRKELALNAYDSANFAQAIDWLAAITPVHRDRDHARWTARSLSRMNEPDAAWTHWTDWFAENPASDSARALHEFALDLGRWSDALRYAEQRGLLRGANTFEAGWHYYLAGDLSVAIDVFERSADRASGAGRARSLYWRARALEAIGSTDAAEAAYAEIEESWPDNYYGLQARNRRIDAASCVPGAAQAATTGPGRADWEALGLRPSSPGGYVDVTLDVPAAPGALRAFADRWGGVFGSAPVAADLYDLGAIPEAQRVFRDVVFEVRHLDAAFAAGRTPTAARPIAIDVPLWGHLIDNRARPRGWWGLSLDRVRYPVGSDAAARRATSERQNRVRADRSAIRADLVAAQIDVQDWHYARREASRLGQGVSGQYIAAWRPWMERYGAAHGVNPYFAWSIMIVESDMNPDSVSSADAWGLLQVIPKTQLLIQLALGDTDFGPAELADPVASIRYGTWYLGQLVENFAGQELLAAIAYNAGPHQVSRWMQWRCEGLDLDEFIETVPFDGARRYAQRTYQHMEAWAEVALGAEHLYLGNRLDCAVTNQVYF